MLEMMTKERGVLKVKKFVIKLQKGYNRTFMIYKAWTVNAFWNWEVPRICEQSLVGMKLGP